jgi:hypothetical protein
MRLNRFIAVQLWRFIPPKGGKYRALEEGGQRGD